MSKRCISIGLLFIAANLCGGLTLAAEEQPNGQGGDAEQEVSFEEKIQPLFQRKCMSCHGVETQKAELSLTNAASIQKGGESGAVVVAGEPTKSLLFEKIHNGEMPPEEKDRLTGAEVELIERWISLGAKYGSDGTNAAASSSIPNQHDVIPIMLRHCTVCHGRRRQEAGLNLQSRETMLQGGKSGPAIVPGKPGQSLMIQRIQSGEMPPHDRLVEVSVKPMEPDEEALLARWIAADAPESDIEPDFATLEPDPLAIRYGVQPMVTLRPEGLWD